MESKDYSTIPSIKEVALCLFSVDPQVLYDTITEAEEAGRDETMERLLCGAVKYLKANRAKPEPAAFLTLMYLAKTKHHFFNTSENVIEVRQSTSSA